MQMSEGINSIESTVLFTNHQTAQARLYKYKSLDDHHPNYKFQKIKK
jgi:hypothetical protein